MTIGDTWVLRWWRGLTVDHIYEQCPALQQSIPELERHGWHTPCDRCPLDPEGGEVCGWCLRVWRARRTSGAQQVA